MNEISLRKAVNGDSEFIYSVKKNALGEYIRLTWGWDEQLQRKMHEDEMSNEDINIIVKDGVDVGTVGIIKNEHEIVITRLYILDIYQSYGTGSNIIERIIKDHPGYTFKLGVLKVNTRARKLYEKLGFKVCGEENEHYRMIYNTFNS